MKSSWDGGLFSVATVCHALMHWFYDSGYFRCTLTSPYLACLTLHWFLTFTPICLSGVELSYQNPNSKFSSARFSNSDVAFSSFWFFDKKNKTRHFYSNSCVNIYIDSCNNNNVYVQQILPECGSHHVASRHCCILSTPGWSVFYHSCVWVDKGMLFYPEQPLPDNPIC